MVFLIYCLSKHIAEELQNNIFIQKIFAQFIPREFTYCYSWFWDNLFKENSFLQYPLKEQSYKVAYDNMQGIEWDYLADSWIVSKVCGSSDMIC